MKWLHFVMSYMRQNKKQKQTLESAQYGLEIALCIIVRGILLRKLVLIWFAIFSQESRAAYISFLQDLGADTGYEGNLREILLLVTSKIVYQTGGLAKVILKWYDPIAILLQD